MQKDHGRLAQCQPQRIHQLEGLRRWVNAIRINGVDTELMSPEEIKKLVPLINMNARYPVLGGSIQRRGGISRHDAVAWGYARAASALGVDIVQQCEVTGFEIINGKVSGVETTQGNISAEKISIAVAGNTSIKLRNIAISLFICGFKPYPEFLFYDPS